MRRKSIAALLMLLVGFILLVGGLFIALQPNEYEAVVRIAVDHTPDPNSYDPYFIQTEFETIQCQAVLDKVIASQNLAEKWSRNYNGGQRLSEAEVEDMVRRRLDLSQVGGKPILVIKVFDDDPAEAAALANSIAETYREYRIKGLLEMHAAGIEYLEKQLNDQNAKVAAIQEKLVEQKRELDISDETTASNQPAATPYFLTKKDLETAQRWRDVLKQKLDAFPSDASAHTVEIVDTATVPPKPIRPNRPLGIAMLIAGLGLIVGGIVMLKSPNIERLSVFQEKQ